MHAILLAIMALLHLTPAQPSEPPPNVFASPGPAGLFVPHSPQPGQPGQPPNFHPGPAPANHLR